MVSPTRLAGRWRKPAPRHALGTAERTKAEPSSTLALLFVLVLTSGFVAGTTATFTAGATNSNSLATGVLDSPSSGIATLRGDSITLSWGLMGGGVDQLDIGYRLRHQDGGQATTTGTSPGCPAATDVAWASATQIAHQTVGPYTHAGIGAAGTRNNTISNYPEGRWVCYKVETVAPCCNPTPGANAWTAINDLSPVHDIQVGHVIQGVTVPASDHDTTTDDIPAGPGYPPPYTTFNNNNLSAGDRIIITFSQAVDTASANAPSSTDKICNRTDFDVIWLGVPSAFNCGDFDRPPGVSNVTQDFLVNLPNVKVGALDVTTAGGNAELQTTIGWATASGVFDIDGADGYSCTPNCTRLQIRIDSGTTGDPATHVKFYPSRMADALRSEHNTAGQSVAENAGGTRYQICTPNPATITDVTDGRCYPTGTGQTNW